MGKQKEQDLKEQDLNDTHKEYKIERIMELINDLNNNCNNIETRKKWNKKLSKNCFENNQQSVNFYDSKQEIFKIVENSVYLDDKNNIVSVSTEKEIEEIEEKEINQKPEKRFPTKIEFEEKFPHFKTEIKNEITYKPSDLDDLSSPNKEKKETLFNKEFFNKEIEKNSKEEKKETLFNNKEFFNKEIEKNSKEEKKEILFNNKKTEQNYMTTEDCSFENTHKLRKKSLLCSII